MSTSMILEHRVSTEVKRLCYAGLDAPTLHRRALACLGRAVPFDGYCAHDADPVSGLGMHMYLDQPDDCNGRFFLEHVYFEDDVNDFNAMIRRRQAVALLSETTGGHLERSLRYRVALVPVDFTSICARSSPAARSTGAESASSVRGVSAISQHARPHSPAGLLRISPPVSRRRCCAPRPRSRPRATARGC